MQIRRLGHHGARSRIAVALACTVVCAGVLVSASPSSAAADARLQRAIILTLQPENTDPTACKERSIDLALAKYYWQVDVTTPNAPPNGSIFGLGSRQVILAEGKGYYWRVCITPFDGFYVVSSLLRSPRGGETTLSANAYIYGSARTDRDALFGSTLRIVT